jgi:hypothetical protein
MGAGQGAENQNFAALILQSKPALANGQAYFVKNGTVNENLR